MSRKNTTKKDGIVLQVVEQDGHLRATLPPDYFRAQQFSSEAAPSMKDQSRPPVPTWLDQGIDWAFWGDDDFLPTTMRQKIERVPMAGRCLQVKIELLVGEHLAYFAEGKEGEGPIEKPEIEAFLDENRIREEWLPNQARDFALLMNSFSEILFANDGLRVTNLYHIEAEAARLSRQNPKTHRTEWLLYSYYWMTGARHGAQAAEESVVKIPIYRWSDPNFWNWLSGRKMAWHTVFQNGGIYYGRPFWLGLFQADSWLDVAASVPGIVSAMQKNQVSLKYIIYIPESYFEFRHPNWGMMSPDQKKAAFEDVEKAYNDYLTGARNAMKSVISYFKEFNGSAMGKVEIVAIDDKTKQGTWVPDSDEANQQIAQAFGIDPSVVGLKTSKSTMGAGSGSDTREGFNTAIQTNTIWQTKLLEPLNWIARRNGWGVRFFIEHDRHVALNESKTGLAPATATDPKGENDPKKPSTKTA